MKNIVIILVALSFIHCGGKKKTTINEHINLIITPDLSNRIEDLYAKPVSDVALISNIYTNYYPGIYNINNRVIGQEDIIQFRFTNPSIINDFDINTENLRMDLSQMNASERISFLANGGNKHMLKTLNTEVKSLYTKAKNNTTGGDIYNYLKKEITTTSIKKTKAPEIIDNNEVITIQRNIIILLTDGYIEAGLYGNKNCRDKKCYYLSKTKVDEFRKAFKASGNTNLKDFFKTSGYGIIPIDNENLKNTEILVSELYDRSLNRTTGSQTVSPNDFEILTLFWEDWLKQSGVKHYKILDTANSKEEFLEELKMFISKV
ncbi:hypothetical protein [Winogradskyella vidalii]|uniref:hypothetical protein n=1 Tax=Winogradskyella vidalii TaxID=2615024 RepID=UPI0015CD2ACD|nr:hypothetical protein [Winogradskyella vidalii]